MYIDETLLSSKSMTRVIILLIELSNITSATKLTLHNNGKLNNEINQLLEMHARRLRNTVGRNERFDEDGNIIIKASKYESDIQRCLDYTGEERRYASSREV